MPIYTARALSGSMKPSPDLASRGIEMKSSTLSMLNAVGLSHYKQIAYSAYKENIVTFMQACVLGQKISTMRAFHNVIIKESEQIPIVTPSVVISFKSAISSEEEVKFTQLGGDIFEGKGKRKMLRFAEGLMTTDMLKEVLKVKRDAEKDTVAIFGQLNLDGYQAFLKAKSLATVFLRTQYYPAFSGPADRPPPRSAFETIDGFMSLKRKIVSEHVARDAEGNVIMNEDEMQADDRDEDDVEYESLSVYDGVPVASPPSENVKIYGGAADMPATSGNVFPYFHQLTEDDPLFITQVCQQYFISAFGDTPVENLAGWRKFEKGIPACAQSIPGRMLAHIFLGIKLAIEVQGRLYLSIQNGRYTGFSLHGYYYTLQIGGFEYAPDSQETMLKDISVIDEHMGAIAGILAVCAKSKGGSKLRGRRAAEFDTPRKLREIVQSMSSLKEEEIQQIDALAGNLSYVQRYWRFTVENILTIVDVLLSEGKLANNYPMYTGGGAMTIENEAYCTFGVFGDHGFSFKVPGGTGIKLPKDKDSDELFKPYKDRKQGKMKTPQKTIVVAKKDILTCIKDFEALKVDRVVVTREQRSSQFRSELFGGSSSKDLWYGLIERMPALEVENKVVEVETKAGGKRKRDDDTDSEVDPSDFL